MENKIRIYVVCHKPAYIPENPLLAPVHAGAALAEEAIPGMLRDDAGENISEKNPGYCELTPQYWAWKNEENDYYGFFHYRRYLSFREVFPVGRDGTRRGSAYRCPFAELDSIREDLTPFGLTEDRMREVIGDHDLVTVLRERINTTVYHQFAQFHGKEPLLMILRIIRDHHPEYLEAAKEYLSSRDIYYMNMYVMKKEMFRTYASWLFDILGRFEEAAKEAGTRLESIPRIEGYLGERLFGIFYTWQRRNGARCAEVPYLRFYDTAPDGGGEPETPVREFRIPGTPLHVKVNMRKLAKICPAGSRRRVLLRSLMTR